MKFVFFGYDFSLPVLERLLSDGHELVSLFTFECDNVFNFNREIVKLAQSKGVTFTQAQPKPSDIEYFTNEGAEVFVACGYPYKIPPIDEARAYGINAHPSRLPKGRGLMPTPHIIMHEPGAAGFTIHKITPSFDAGDILYQDAIQLRPDETVDSYSAGIAARGPDVFSKIMNELPEYWANAQPQNEKEASHFKPPTEEMRTIKWDYSVEKIDRIGRAFGTFGSLAVIENAVHAIFEYQTSKQDHEHDPGQVLERSADTIKIAAQDGVVTLNRFMKL